MKKKLLTLGVIAVAGLVWYGSTEFSAEGEQVSHEILDLRKKHQDFLMNHPFNETMNLEKQERRALGLPPNAFNEQDFLYTMDPSLGTPVPERMFRTYEQLVEQLVDFRLLIDGPLHQASFHII